MKLQLRTRQRIVKLLKEFCEEHGGEHGWCKISQVDFFDSTVSFNVEMEIAVDSKYYKTQTEFSKIADVWVGSTNKIELLTNDICGDSEEIRCDFIEDAEATNLFIKNVAELADEIKFELEGDESWIAAAREETNNKDHWYWTLQEGEDIGFFKAVFKEKFGYEPEESRYLWRDHC